MGETYTQVFLIRHGETESNVEGRFRGRANIPLSKNGFVQASELANSLSETKIDVIYSSPLLRAKQTAEKLAITKNLPIVEHSGFQNIDLGDWTHKLKDEVKRDYPIEWAQWTTLPEYMTIPGGENIIEVRNRARKALDKLVRKHDGENVVIFTHRAVLKPLIASLLSMPSPFFWKLHLETASYSLFHYYKGKGYVMQKFNHTSHLSSIHREIF